MHKERFGHKEHFGNERTEAEGSPVVVSRRSILEATAWGGVAASLGALSLGAFGASAWGQTQAEPKALKKVNLAWSPAGVCLSPVALAQQRGVFAKHGLEVEFVNFGGSTETLLEALATGKAHAGVGMALRWLKPLEQGFDVKIVAGTHGGCMRVLALKSSGVTQLSQLKGKVVGVSDLGSPAKNFFAITLTKLGVDPNKDVEWRVYPGDLLSLAAEKGEVEIVAHWDPDTYRFLKSGKFVEVSSNLDGEYAHRVCCVVGVGGKVIREDLPTATALTRALLEAQAIASSNPEKVAEVYATYQPKYPQEDVIAMLKSQTHNHTPVGTDIKREIALYAEDLKVIQVLKPSTDPVKFAERVYANVFV